MGYEINDDWNLDGLVDDWIKEHGAEALEEKAREILIEAMGANDAGQLRIIICPLDKPESFSVNLDGPPELVEKATAVLQENLGSSD